MLNSRSSHACVWRVALLLAVAALSLWPEKAVAQARSLAGGLTGFKQTGSSSSAATSETATAATAAAAEAAQAAATASGAQTSLANSVASFQRLAQAQMAAQIAAEASTSNHLGSATNPINGIAVGGLLPVGGIPATTTSAIQVVDLSGNGSQLTLSNGGTVALPSGTSGTDQVSVNGSGSVTSTSGSVSASAGSLTTTTGGTLAATNGGTISLTAGSATLSTTTATNLSSNVAGSYTSGGSTVSFAANTAVSVPAGASVSFTGSNAATVTVSGAATVKLSGAGTLALSGATAGGGGTITTNSGTTQFTDAVITSQPAGTTISLSGSGSIDFSGASTDVLPVILEANTLTQAPPAFTTTGSVLQTTGFTVPPTWTLGTGGSLSQSFDASTGQYVDTVTQTQQQALLYWQTFNIGSNTTLDFDQSAGGANVGEWVAINRILDPTLNPTQILGAIEAPGQVYVINQNGIIFGGGAQINTHALVASTLPINTNLVDSGLLNNASGQFLFTSQAIPSNSGSTPYDPNNDSSQIVTSSGTITQANTLPNVASGGITVQEGASLFSPGSAEGVGGKIALIAPTIDNEGDISAPDGQIILAAGQQVGFTAHPTQDPSLRGLDVAIGEADTGTALATGDPAMDTVTNGVTGLIYAPEADVTIAAPSIVQNGIIESTTSVALNGRIDLLAMSNLTYATGNAVFETQGDGVTPTTGGSIVLGADSLTEILPDYASSDTEVGTSLALPSQIYVEGASFEMMSNAEIIAPNATTTFGIGILNTPIASATGETSNPLAEDVGAQGGQGASTTNASPATPIYYLSGGTQNQVGQVTLDDGSLIDVSGSSDVQASVTENIVEAQLTAAVLENDPLQRDGQLHGDTVTVDITQTGTNADGSTWVGSPIGDLSGYANLIEHNVGELTIAGGSVNINTNGSVDLSAGSTVNVSGGSINYAGADVQTTNLVAANGQIVNISEANPNEVYTGIFTGDTTSSAKWGVSQTISPSLDPNTTFDPGYVQGGAGGSFSINASSALLQGSLYGNTAMGVRQQSSPPSASVFSLNVQNTINGDNPPAVNVVIQSASDPISTDPGTIDLSDALFGVDGFSDAKIVTGSGNLTVAADASITTNAGGSLNFTAANVEIDGLIDVPSGAITLVALPKDPNDEEQGNASPYDPTIGNLVVSTGATIATTGLTFDELGSTPAGTLPFSVNGGSVTISGASTTIAAGSIIDASGGIARSAAGTIYDGKGGGISIAGFYEGSEDQGKADGQLTLNGSLSAYGLGTGGSLNLTAPAVIVDNGNNATGQPFPTNATPLTLSGDFFSQGGFSNISVVGSAGVQILGGTTIAPVLTEAIADTTSAQFGISLISSSQLPAFPAAPVNLSFSAPGSTGSYIATLSLGANASIVTAPTGNVSLTGQLVDILGNVTAPGGNITVTGASTASLGLDQPGIFAAPVVTVYLGPNSSLSVSGEEITTPTQYGDQVFNTGEVLNGGKIAITGNIVGDAGASLQANGASGGLSVPYSSTTSSLNSTNLQQLTNPYVQQTIASNGGSISINGIEEAYFAGSVSAKPGASGATTGIGGTLTFGSGLAATFTAPPNAGYAEIFLEQSGTFATGPVTLGQALTTGSQTGGGYFTIQQFNDGGFGSLILKGNVEFENGSTNPITINASQEVEILPDSLNGTIFADGSDEAITINAPYIEIGATTLTIDQLSVSNDAPTYVGLSTSTGSITATPTLGLADPTFGSASLTLNATDLIDVGFLSLQNFGTANLSVPTGDIRGGGLFYAAGTINLTAGQIYTPTAATFTVAAFGDDNSVNGGTINILPGVARPLPLSAGGTLNIFATTIVQDGNLEAPFGVINLGALDSPGTGETPVLAGVTFSFDSINDKFDITTADASQTAPVTQSLTLGAGSITSVSGVSGSEVLDLPYGTIENGSEWLAPNGQDITAGGLPTKAININGNNVNDATGAVINLTGGGDLFAYEFNPGVTGTNDILSIDKFVNGQIEVTSSNLPVASTSFAILPTYGLNYAPIDLTVDDTGAFPYENSTLASQIGNVIYLSGGDGVAAGTYAILPARYALLPGAYLVTPTNSKVAQTSENPDGSIDMAGYTYNALNPNAQIVPNVTGYQIDSNAVVANAAPYTVSSADTFLAAGATAAGNAVPRLPEDAGELVFDATAGLQINGTLLGQAGPNGLGSTVDIGSSDDIYIVSNQGDAPTLTIPTGEDVSDYDFLTLSASQLDAFGADSLLIGGTRTSSTSGTTINAQTDNIYVQNDSSAPLSGNEIILVSNQTINLAAGASIQQSGVVSTGQENLNIGNASVAGSGDGTLLRVTSDPNATFTRLGLNTADTVPNLVIGAGASVSGVAVTLDSSNGTTIDPTALIDQNPNLHAQSLVLNSGAISLQVDPNVSVASAPGLVLGSSALQALATSVDSLALSSYSTINLYGAGTIGALGANNVPVIKSLTLEGSGIFGFDNGGGSVTINAQNVNLGNPNNDALPGTVPSVSGGGTFAINANTINFGSNALAIDGFSGVQLNANNGMLVSGTGALNAQGSLVLATSEITGSTAANYTFDAMGGTLAVTAPAAAGDVTVTGGLGAAITFEGAGVTMASAVTAPSGTISAVATSGNVELQSGADLNAGGEAIDFGSAVGDTSGGAVNLTSTTGNVLVDAGAEVNVAAPAGGGNAGTLAVTAAQGSATIADGSLEGQAGNGGAGGIFNATLGEAAMLSSLTTPLSDGGFQTMSFDILTGSTTVDGAVGPVVGQNGVTSFTLTTETGAITVDNTINASGVTGGTINLYADEGVTLTGNAVLSVTGQQLDDAGEGGSIDIETRGDNGGVLDLGAGSQLLLGVGTGSAIAAAGTVHLRAPQTLGGAVLAINSSAVADGMAADPIAATISNAGGVTVEAYRVYQPAGGSIDSVESQVTSDVAAFPTTTIAAQLGVSGNALYQIDPGVEIINPTGNLTLTNNWNLATLRTSAGLPGILTLRASGDLIFNGSLTDGFAENTSDPENTTSPYTWDLLPVGSESWSYRLVAGAAFNASSASTANFGEVVAQAAAASGTLAAGSLELGQVIPVGFNFGTKTSTTANTFAQLIRTGTGNITIDTGGSVYLMNQMATIYTAGQLAPTIAGFDSPTGVADTAYETKVYGTTIAPATQYTAQYTENGGNITINAGQNIDHVTKNSAGQFVADTSWQFPTNWLYRRGATSSTGVFDTTMLDSAEIASTTWWVDFSNFFEGIGALGGGNVSLNAGDNIINVDAVVPTNARMPFADASGNPLADSAANLVQLGGGDLSVIAGGTIEGGTYYVEQGNGLIQAGTIATTFANDPARVSADDKSHNSNTPLPLTLFLGSGTFTVAATNGVTLGSTVNPFLLPQGIGNNFNNESVFSTYGADSTVNVSSLLGTISIQGSETNGDALAGSLADAYSSNASPGGLKASTFTKEKSLTGTPWTLTLDAELNQGAQGTSSGIDSVLTYSNFYNFSPPIFDATAFSGNIQYLSSQTLAPSADGTLRLLASGAVEGAFNSSSIGNGLTAQITILDDNPAQLPGVTNPLGLGSTTVDGPNNPSIGTAINTVYGYIGEEPSYELDTFTTLQSEHTPGLLHDNSTTPPVEIDTINGNIEDLTLISPEKVSISSGLDLDDVSFYIQNNNADDVSIVSADRNITLFDPDSPELLSLGAAESTNATFGDIQISGPGTLEVLAGGNLNLGEGTSPVAQINPGTNLGIVSIGDARDPYLPFGGAEILAAAGVGATTGLNSNQHLVDYSDFISNYLDFTNSAATDESVIYLPDLGSLLGVSGATNQQIWDIFSGTPDGSLTTSEDQVQASLSPEQRDALATTIFYDVLRDAGRDHNNPASPGFGNYDSGFAAISALFPSTGSYTGDITLTSREIKTTNGGDIGLLVPGGEINVGLNNLGAQAVDQGILTVDGGNISIFANDSVNVGTSRIFTLHGGNVIIWSTTGDIDAGAASRTVQSAPPTRVLVDSQSADVQTDLAGLATGGGIGVLETVIGAPPGNVDLIAPVGTVNAGDAGIRASGNVNVAAAQVLNAGNIQAGGSKTGTGSTATPNIAAAVAGSNAAGSSQNAATASANQQQPDNSAGQSLPSIITVQVLGFGGGDDDSASTETPSDQKTSGATYLADHASDAGGTKY